MDAASSTRAPPWARPHCYVVRAVASTDPLIESAPSNEACVDNRDVMAPAAPPGLAVLPREGGLEILWGPSADADVAGYRVYRTAAGGPRERLVEVPQPHGLAGREGAAGRGLRLHGGRLRRGRQREPGRRAGGGEPPVSRPREEGPAGDIISPGTPMRRLSPPSGRRGGERGSVGDGVIER